MRYTSTRDPELAVESAEAIHRGIAPDGGLFVPESIPSIPLDDVVGRDSYHELAVRILAPLLPDFSPDELVRCVQLAYNQETFDVGTVVGLEDIDPRRSVLELWHGPTAAFKDVALQIMPHFLAAAKAKVGAASHTVILVATSGDTGKAALEGFRDCDGLSIIVFYPHCGVSEIQRLQMATTTGANTHVFAVRGNFDDCQTAVKTLFGDPDLADRLAGRGFAFSSANSINWGRLCPQIVYYFQAYAMLVRRGRIASGDLIDFCVPTGNFGNILAAYYARAMGLPVDRLICASNKNRVLADFFTTALYDRNREFHRTMSPSMDILISSNLERFLFEVTDHDAEAVKEWYASLSETGSFRVPESVGAAFDDLIVPGWVDETRVLETIGRVHRTARYVLDPHTAVAVAVSDDVGDRGRYTVIDSTASPFKFSRDVVCGLTGSRIEDEFESIRRLEELSGQPVHRAVANLREKPVRHDRVIEVGGMERALLEILDSVSGAPRE